MKSVAVLIVLLILVVSSPSQSIELSSPQELDAFIIGQSIPVSWSGTEAPSEWYHLKVEFYVRSLGTYEWTLVTFCDGSCDGEQSMEIPGDSWDVINTEYGFEIGAKEIWYDNPYEEDVIYFDTVSNLVANLDSPGSISLSDNGSWKIGDDVTVSWAIDNSTRIEGFQIWAKIPDEPNQLLHYVPSSSIRSVTWALQENALEASHIFVKCLWDNTDPAFTDSDFQSVSVSQVDPFVEVIYPNSSLTWTVGEVETIAWTACSNCNILGHTVELQRGGGVWQELAQVGAAIRLFDWTVVGPESADCRIRITSSVEGSVDISDESDALFVIQPIVPSFTDVTNTALLQPYYNATGISLGDFDQDGWDDLYFPVLEENGPSGVFRNNGNGTFSLTSHDAAIQGNPSFPYWLDIDNDGNTDLYAQNNGSDIMVEWNGAQFETFPNVPAQSTLMPYSSTWVDLEPDGDMDFYVTDFNNPNAIYVNDGTGVFVESTTTLPGHGLESDLRLSWADFDLDGDLDLYLPSKDSGDIFYENLGGGQYADIHSSLFGLSLSSRATTWCDFDNDGDMDLATTTDDRVFRLFRNDEGQSFTEIPAAVHQVAADRSVIDMCWQDFDNDGFLDVAIAAWYTGSSVVYRGQGDGTFLTMGEFAESTASVKGIAASDFDRDGDIDLFTAPSGNSRIIRNDGFSGDNHWVQLNLVGTVSNRSAIGARVVLLVGGFTQTRVVGSGDGLFNQSSQIVSFGLGGSDQITGLEIHWPSGVQQDATALVSVDGRVTITEPSHLLTAQINQDSQLVPLNGNTLFACPAGDADELVIEIDFDDNYAIGTIDASNISLEVDGSGYSFCGLGYNDEDGNVSNGYTVTIRRKQIYGCSCCEGEACNVNNIASPEILVKYNGLQVGSISGLKIKSPDFSGDGAINLVDVSMLVAANGSSLGDVAFDGCVDLSGDNTVNLVDVVAWSPHNNHLCNAQKRVNSYSVDIDNFLQVTPIGSDSSQYRISFNAPVGIESLGIEIPLDGVSVAAEWPVDSASENVISVVGKRDNRPILFIYVVDCSKFIGQYLTLVDLVVSDSAKNRPSDVLRSVSGSIVESSGEVLMIAGSNFSEGVIAHTTKVVSVYPNPFNPQVTIKYSVGKPSHIKIQIFDVSGRLVRTLVDEYQNISTSERSTVWFGRSDSGINVSSGVYFWRIEAGGISDSGRLVMLK